MILSKMTFWRALSYLAVPLVLLVLTALAGFVYSEISFLSLPIPKALALFTVVLPFISGISTQGVNDLIQRSSKRKQNQLTLPLIAIIGFQIIYETVVATLALTYVLPPSALECGLDRNWDKLFRARNGDGIRAIQDRFQCCGYRTIKDRAFPFQAVDPSTGKTVPSTCARDFGRSESCLAFWRRAEQSNAGWLLLIVVIVFILKSLQTVAILTRPSWLSSRWGRYFVPGGYEAVEEPDEDHRASMRGLIEEGAEDEEYHDDAEEDSSAPRVIEAPKDDNGQGPRVQPSQLVEAGHEWRDEGEGHRN